MGGMNGWDSTIYFVSFPARNARVYDIAVLIPDRASLLHCLHRLALSVYS